MGADRIVTLTRDISEKELETIFGELGMDFSHQQWGYSTELDISIVPQGIHFHYGYWGINHATNAQLRVKQILRKLRKLGILKKLGRWNY